MAPLEVTASGAGPARPAVRAMGSLVLPSAAQLAAMSAEHWLVLSRALEAYASAAAPPTLAAASRQDSDH